MQYHRAQIFLGLLCERVDYAGSNGKLAAVLRGVVLEFCAATFR
jgi:hypothetical protein